MFSFVLFSEKYIKKDKKTDIIVKTYNTKDEAFDVLKEHYDKIRINLPDISERSHHMSNNAFFISSYSDELDVMYTGIIVECNNKKYLGLCLNNSTVPTSVLYAVNDSNFINVKCSLKEYFWETYGNERVFINTNIQKCGRKDPLLYSVFNNGEYNKDFPDYEAFIIEIN